MPWGRHRKIAPDNEGQDKAAGGAAGRLMTWPDLLERPRPAPDHDHPLWRRPAAGRRSLAARGRRPAPGRADGPWRLLADRDRRPHDHELDRRRSPAARHRGLEHRLSRRRPAGGGYPGTFQDVAAAADALRTHAARYRLDAGRVVAIGHSAGGHLALWLAARPRLPAASPLRTANPLRIAEVVSLGGLPDLEEAARAPGSGCGTEVIARISGGRFAETSVPRLAPLGVPQVLINGRQDRIIPTAYAEGYARPMRAAGDDVRVRMLDATGHVELVAPETDAWAAAVEELRRAFGR